MSLSISLAGTRKLKNTIKELSKIFPEEVRAMVLEVALVDVETYAKANEIPVDTGRLRASIHTKYKKKPNPETATTKRKLQKLGYLSESQETFTYEAEDGKKNPGKKQFDGTLSEIVDLDTVVVGTNVEYAQKINRVGGGGDNSRRTDSETGLKRPKGYGKNFFDKAVENGERNLINELSNLSKRLEREIVNRAKAKAKDGDL